MTTPDPFRWNKEGDCGLSIPRDTKHLVSHEVMYEGEITHIKDRSLFVDASIPSRRFFLAGALILGLMAALLGRAFWMQVIQGGTFRELADRNRLRRDVLPARRGIVRDREGRVLAENIPSFDVRMIERSLPAGPREREEALGRVGRLIGATVGEIEAVFASSTDPDDSVVVRRDIPYDRAIGVKILAADIPGLEVAVGSKRQYTLSSELPTLSHVLGYISGITREELKTKKSEGYRQIDLIGKTGVEASYESQLRGVPGEKVYEVDARHRVTATVGEREPVDGQDLYLTLDLDLQRAAEKQLKAAIERAKIKRGAVVILDPRDGSILALASWPAYDNNIFSGTVSSTQYKALIVNPEHPLLPRAWAGAYPSGSTIKPVISAAALAEGIVTPRTVVYSVGGLRIGPWFFPDWKPGGHGATDVRRAIAWSVNTFFYYVGGGYDRFVGLGVDRLTNWMRRFGLGSKTGLDIPGEVAGFVPSREWKEKVKNERWFIGDTYNLSIGQGDLLVTPLQVALFTAEIANGGYKLTPRIGMKYGRPDEHVVEVASGRSEERVAAADVVQTVRFGMRDTVIYGSGRALADLPFPAAGKTGTAQWRSDKANHAWFTSFAPFEKPEIVVTVLLEEGEEGSRTAVPVAEEILRVWGY